jgi:hypothetical protein
VLIVSGHHALLAKSPDPGSITDVTTSIEQCGGKSAMNQWMPFIVALLSLTGAALRAQNISPSTQPDPGRRVLAVAGREISAEQLEQMLAGNNRQRDVKVAKQLSGLELTERLSAARLARCEANLPGPDARRALIALADRASFLDPPTSEIPTIAEPDPQAQNGMIALSEDYIKTAIHQLPNFYATRVTISFEHNKKPLHWVSTESAIVRYRDGQEERPSVTPVRPGNGSGAGGMTTAGEFGPILYVVLADSVQGNLTWSHWEQGEAGPEAVYRYAVIAGKSHYRVNGLFRGYHAEITIDPSNGTIRRLVLRADPVPNLPLVKADIVVEYGPVELGGKTYICPLKGIALSATWNRWWLNDVAFEKYHLYHANAQLLPGFANVP